MPLAELVGAQAELAKGNFRKAEELDLAALDRDPVSPAALELLVKLYARVGREPEAIERLSTLVSQYPQNAGLQVLVALAYFELKDFQLPIFSRKVQKCFVGTRT